MSLLPADDRRRVLDEFPPETFAHEWWFWARPNQLPPPGDWRLWLILAGRGFGKTRTGVEWVRREVEAGRLGRLGLIGRTAADVRDVIVEGESGILATARPGFRPRYEPSKRRVTWPNGAIATTYSAEEPDTLRGPQHDGLLADELAAWKYPETWDMAQFGLRLGANPRAVGATTPRPTRLIKDLMRAPTTHLTVGTTYDNLANLPQAFVDQIIRKYEGTRQGRQELMAELLDDVPGALWTYAMLEDRRPAPDLARVVVAVDPSGGDDPENDEQGIVVAGTGIDGRGYALADRTCKLSPDGWARRTIQAYIDHRADYIVAEVNYGGAMVEHTIKTAAQAMGVIAKVKVIHASRGKAVRAQPVSALYEQGRVSHTEVFPELEEEMTSWTPESGTSPNRMDALVWALTELMVGQPSEVAFF
jgi:predicted phage terminase large subunit-like protein